MSELTTVWLGLRADGIELDRVAVHCEEVSRSNGIAKYRVVSPILFTDVAASATEPVLTAHDGPNDAPFAGTRLISRVRAGDNVTVTDATFERILDVPRHVRDGRRWWDRLLA